MEDFRYEDLRHVRPELRLEKPHDVIYRHPRGTCKGNEKALMLLGVVIRGSDPLIILRDADDKAPKCKYVSYLLGEMLLQQ